MGPHLQMWQKFSFGPLLLGHLSRVRQKPCKDLISQKPDLQPPNVINLAVKILHEVWKAINSRVLFFGTRNPKSEKYFICCQFSYLYVCIYLLVRLEPAASLMLSYIRGYCSVSMSSFCSCCLGRVLPFYPFLLYPLSCQFCKLELFLLAFKHFLVSKAGATNPWKSFDISFLHPLAVFCLLCFFLHVEDQTLGSVLAKKALYHGTKPQSPVYCLRSLSGICEDLWPSNAPRAF